MAQALDRLRRWGRGYHWWQWMIRIAVVVVLLVIIGYATLPWWLPAGLVAGRIETTLKETLGTDVALGDLSVGWRRGVRIASLTVADPLDPAAPPLLTTGKVTADFAPLRLLLERRLDRMSVRDPRVNLRTDASGRWNLPTVERRDGGDVLVVENIHISDGTVTVAPPAADEPIRLSIADVQIRAGDDRPFEHATFTGHLLQDNRRVPIAASVTVRPADGADDEMIVRGSFSRLDPAPLAALADVDLPVERIEGTLEGSIVAVSLGTRITEADLALAPTGGPGRLRLRIDEASLGTTGAGRLAAATVNGTIDVEALEALLASLAPGTPPARWLAGDAGGDVMVRYRDDTLDLSGTLGGEALAIRIPDAWRKDAGEPMSLTYAVRLDPTQALAADATLRTAGATLTLQGGRRQGAWTARGTLETDDAQALLGHVPALTAGNEQLQWNDVPLTVVAAATLKLNPGGGAGGELALTEGRARLGESAVSVTGLIERPDDPTKRVASVTAEVDLSLDEFRRRGGTAVAALLDETGLSGRLRAEADLQGLPAAPCGSVSARADQLDVGALREAAPQEPAAEAQRPPLTPDDRRSLTDRAREAIRTARRWTADADVDFDFDVTRAGGLTVAGLVGPVDATEVALEGIVANGRIEANGGASLQAARLRGRAETDLTDPAPWLLLAGSVRNLLATGDLEATLLKLLPELEVRGSISREVDVRIPLIDLVAALMDPRYIITPVGQARTTLIDGLLRGLAPPAFIERVLPGLNLAAFAYDRASATTDYQADGTVRNVATLTGDRYSLYIEGAVETDGAASYDLGVMVAGADGGPAWLEQIAGQRIPLLTRTFRIVDDRKVDESVTWTFPAESLLRSFIRNDLLRDVLPDDRRERPNGPDLDLFDLLPVPGHNRNTD